MWWGTRRIQGLYGLLKASGGPSGRTSRWLKKTGRRFPFNKKFIMRAKAIATAPEPGPTIGKSERCSWVDKHTRKHRRGVTVLDRRTLRLDAT